MRVCIDGLVFERSHQRGIQRYFRGIIDNLPPGFDVDIVLSDSARAPLPDRARTSPPPALVRPLPRAWRRALGRRRRASRERQADVFHSSYYTCQETDIPAVLTVQDMIVERFTDYFHSRWADEEVRSKRDSIIKATVLITGSHDTAADLKAFFPSLADRIVTVHHGADHIPAVEGPRPMPGADAFALCVGDRGSYKNFRCVLEALADRSWPRELSLVVIGPEPRENEQAMIDRIGASRVRFVGRVDEPTLRTYYATARATIVPSLAEGFGFPVLEAQRALCPVVCSDIAVFREIAADSAAYFDPVRPDQLGEALARVMEPSEATVITEAGRTNSARFTWARAAELTAAAYQRAVASRA